VIDEGAEMPTAMRIEGDCDKGERRLLTVDDREELE
jgi:hypothetical protein